MLVLIAILAGGALVFAALAYTAIRAQRREDAWRARHTPPTIVGSANGHVPDVVTIIDEVGEDAGDAFP